MKSQSWSLKFRLLEKEKNNNNESLSFIYFTDEHLKTIN